MMAYVRETYGVPAKRGRRVRVWYYDSSVGWRLAAEGTITSATHHIWIKSALSGTVSGPYHPTYQVEYLSDTGKTILDTREA